MSAQLDLLDAERIAQAAWERSDETIQQAFERFHADHPRVYELLVQFARQLKGRGYEHAGIRMVWERMRWEVALNIDPREPFKLNDHYTSRYVRLLNAEPGLEGFFRVRELRAE